MTSIYKAYVGSNCFLRLQGSFPYKNVKKYLRIFMFFLLCLPKGVFAIQTDIGVCHKTNGPSSFLHNVTITQCLQEILDRWHPRHKIEDVRITKQAVEDFYSWNFWVPNTYIGALWATSSCHSPYSWDSSENLCTKYCPPEKPDLENGVCTGPEVIQQCAGNPVIISNGTKVQSEAPDILISGTYPLYFLRSYNSQRSLEAQELRQHAIQILTPTDKSTWVKHVQPAGYKGLHIGYAAHYIDELINNTRLAGYKSWTHNYFGLLEVLGSSVRLNSSQFANRSFTLQADGSYKPTNITSDSLTRIEDATGGLLHWVYRSASNQTEQYNAQGQLVRRTNSAGLSHHLTYDTKGNIEVVKDDADNQLLFTYDDKGKLTTLTSSDGSMVTYGYDQVANLETVTKSLVSGKETVRSYHYEDARHPYALTGITDENGARYATWEYDELGRAVVSKHANETNKTSFEFTTNKTTVTNPLGKQTIYNYNTIAGAKRLETVEGVATASCLGANQNYEYYSNGQLKSKTNSKGIKTEFIYNERGLEIQRTEALNSSEQRVITTIWHAQFNLPTTITIDDQVTIYDYDSNGLLTTKSKSHL